MTGLEFRFRRELWRVRPDAWALVSTRGLWRRLARKQWVRLSAGMPAL